MRTALDTNILSALWSNEPAAAAIADWLLEAKESGAVLVSGIVYAELLANPGASEGFLADFCAKTGVVIDFRRKAA